VPFLIPEYTRKTGIMEEYGNNGLFGVNRV